jgi:hypothetical protein
MWDPPVSVIEAIWFHRRPNRSGIEGFTPLTAVHLANHPERKIIGPAFGAVAAPLDLPSSG